MSALSIHTPPPIAAPCHTHTSTHIKMDQEHTALGSVWTHRRSHPCRGDRTRCRRLRRLSEIPRKSRTDARLSFLPPASPPSPRRQHLLLIPSIDTSAFLVGPEYNPAPLASPWDSDIFQLSPHLDNPPLDSNVRSTPYSDSAPSFATTFTRRLRLYVLVISPSGTLASYTFTYLPFRFCVPATFPRS